MNKKAGALLLILSILLLSSNILAQAPEDIGNAGALDEDAQKILDAAEKLKEFTEEDKFEYLGSQWKELLLKRESIAKIDTFLKSINPIFLILLSRSYTFSIELIFVIIIWLITFFSLRKYIIWFKAGWQKWGVSLLGTLLLAHIQFFNLLASIVFKLIFYKKTTYWIAIGYGLLLFGTFTYYFLNKYFAAMLIKSQENKAKDKEKLDREILHNVTDKITNV